MSGDATAGGISYQARLTAWVYCHILDERQLGWFPFDDTPVAVSAETKGPGDDVRIEFKNGEICEVQAKRGFNAKGHLNDFLEAAKNHTDQTTTLVLVVNRASTQTLYGAIALDLNRIRDGRVDALTKNGIALHAKWGAPLLSRLRIFAIDVDDKSSPETKLALGMLRTRIKDANRESDVLALFEKDALDLMSKRLRRTRMQLKEIINANKIQVGPPASEHALSGQLDAARVLLGQNDTDAARSILARLGTNDNTLSIESQLRVGCLNALLQLQLGNYQAALETALRYKAIDTGTATRCIAAHASCALGDPGSAQNYVREAHGIDATDVYVWRAAEKAFANTTGLFAETPSHVLAQREYREAKLLDLINEHEYEHAVRLSGQLLQEDYRSNETILFRARALLAQFRASSGSTRDIDLQECLSLLSEARDGFRTNGHSSAEAYTLVHRADTLFLLQRDDESQTQIEQAYQEFPDELSVIVQWVRLQMQRGNFDALALLEAKKDKDPGAYVEWIHLLAAKEPSKARSELNKLATRASAFHPAELIRLAETALHLGENALAQQLSESAGSSNNFVVAKLAIGARLARRHGDKAKCYQLYGEALVIAKSRPIFAEVQLEFCSILFADGEFDKVLAGLQPLHHAKATLGVRRLVGRSLFKLTRFTECLTYIAHDLEPPSTLWALEIAAEIAIQRNDLNGAAGHLEAILTHDKRPSVALQLAIVCIDLGKIARAEALAVELSASTSLTIEEQHDVCVCLSRTTQPVRAVVAAYNFCRANPNALQLRKLLHTLTLHINHDTAREVAEVGTSVCVQLPGGDFQWFSIHDAPKSELAFEISLAQAAARGLVGKRQGDNAPFFNVDWNPTSATVFQVAPAWAAMHDDTTRRMASADGHMGNSAIMIKMGDIPSLSDTAPLIHTLANKTTQAKTLQNAHYNRQMPIDGLISIFGIPATTILSLLAGDNGEIGIIHSTLPKVWVAPDSKKMVLTRFGLFTWYIAGLGPPAQGWQMIAPQSLVLALGEEIRAATRMSRDGVATLGLDGGIFTRWFAPPGAPVLEYQEAILTAQLDWLQTHCQIEARPIAALEPCSAPHQIEQCITETTKHALELATEHEADLWCDDYLLQSLVAASSWPNVRCVGTFSVIEEFSKGSDESVQAGFDAMARLIEHGYCSAPVSADLLLAICKRGNRRTLQRTVEFLTNCPTIVSAAEIFAELLKRVVVTITSVSENDVLRMALSIRTQRWTPDQWRRQLIEALRMKLLLLPIHLRRLETFVGREEN
jgi:tetratricopeptide (TPR) repeat protein